MIRIDNASKLIFSSSLLAQWGTFNKANIKLELNCCKTIGEWEILAPQNSDINESVIDFYMSQLRYVEFSTSLEYEIKGVRVLDTVTGMVHLIEFASLEAWANLEGREFTDINSYTSTSGSIREILLGISSTDEYFVLGVVNPVNWELLGIVVEDVNGAGSLIPMVTAFHEDGVYIGYNTITVNLIDTELVDGVYGVTIVITKEDGSTETISTCAFVDNEMKCMLVDYLIDNPTSHVYHIYVALKNATYCNDCTCSKLCNLYEILYREVYKKDIKTKSIASNGCGCS
jgi:hypothetical protein